jgi:hypothetical protein
MSALVFPELHKMNTKKTQPYIDFLIKIIGTILVYFLNSFGPNFFHNPEEKILMLYKSCYGTERIGSKH